MRAISSGFPFLNLHSFKMALLIGAGAMLSACNADDIGEQEITATAEEREDYTRMKDDHPFSLISGSTPLHLIDYSVVNQYGKLDPVVWEESPNFLNSGNSRSSISLETLGVVGNVTAVTISLFEITDNGAPVEGSVRSHSCTAEEEGNDKCAYFINEKGNLQIEAEDLENQYGTVQIEFHPFSASSDVDSSKITKEGLATWAL